MCGIAGVYHRSDGGPVDHPGLNALARAQFHRGPDAFGSWVSADRRAGLAAQRLAIVDRSPAGRQPAPGCRDDIRLVFNGELYDHAVIRRELEAAGHRFRSALSDTEVAVHAYEQWGTACVRRFRGEFALAIWDGPANRLFLARDRLGVKPLHYAITSRRILFASEAAALLTDPGVDRRIDPQAVSDHLTLLCVPAPATFFRGVRCLEAGTTLTVGPAATRIERYWDAAEFLNSPEQGVTEDQAAEEVTALVDQAVRLRVPAEVPFATTMSSGVDSILVTGAAAQTVPGATAHVAESAAAEAVSEACGARRAATALGIDLRVHTLSDDRFRSSYQRFVLTYRDGPVAAHDVIVLNTVCVAARAEGGIVLLVGEGGDEIGGGYPSYARAGGLASAADRHIQVFPTVEKRRWWHGPPVSDAEVTLRSLLDGVDGALPDATVRQTLLGEFRLRLPQMLLPRVDAATMAASVEARPPLLDHLLVERSLRLPSSASWRDGEPKYVLRQLLRRRYGHDLAARRKLGFGRAFGPMLSRSLPGWVESDVLGTDHALFDYVDRRAVVALQAAARPGGSPVDPNAGFRLWVLYALAIWLQEASS